MRLSASSEPAGLTPPLPRTSDTTEKRQRADVLLRETTVSPRRNVDDRGIRRGTDARSAVPGRTQLWSALVLGIFAAATPFWVSRAQLWRDGREEGEDD